MNDEKESSNSGIRVFVYGTLKKGGGNHYLLGGSKFLGRCVIRGAFAMLDLTYYPGCVRTDGVPDTAARDILGEVYLVDEETLVSLDILEGNGSYFTRSKVSTPYKKAWAYFLPSSYYHNNYKIIASGIWDATKEEEDFLASQAQNA